MNVVVAAGGRFHSLHLANQLQKQGYLKKLYTQSYTPSDELYVSRYLVCNNRPLKSAEYLYCKLGLSRLFNPAQWYILKDNLFDRWIGKKITNEGNIDIFVGWAHYWLGSSHEIRKTGAKIVSECGSRHILDQLSLLGSEYDKFGIKLSPVDPSNIEKILSEYLAADFIMTPSKNVYDSFLKHGVSKEKLLKVPYGVDVNKFYYERAYKKDFFRVIFVGSIGLQKGVQYLVNAWNRLGLPESNAELLLVGPVENNFKKVLKTLKIGKTIKFCGSVSQDRLIELYKKASVFALPSIQDGLAMVQAEAMASGLPVICTTNTGGDELIEDGKEGFIIPIRDVDKLAKKIMWCYENREGCFEMGLLAQKKAQDFTWDCYGKKVIEAYRSIL